MSIPKIFEQRTGYVEQQRSYDIPTFGCDILVALTDALTERASSYSSVNFFDNSFFTTTYLVDYFADALFSYHAAYGYYFNTNETFDEIMNRNDFNYFLLDNGWNVPKIVKDSLDGWKSLSPFYRTRETSQEYIDRLGLGFRIHNTAYNNFQAWDLNDIGNGEIWLAIKFIGDDSLWIDNPGIIQIRQFEIFCYNPQYPDIQLPLEYYNISWNGQDERFHIEAKGNIITITWNNTTSPDESISGTIDIQITNAQASFPYKPCFIKNGLLQIDYLYSEYKLDGDYSEWDIVLIPTIQKNIYDVVENDQIEQITFSDDFEALSTQPQVLMWFDNGILYISDNGSERIVVYATASGVEDTVIWDTNNGFWDNHTWSDGTSWDFDTKTLTLTYPKIVTSNNITNTDYTGTAIANVYI